VDDLALLLPNLPLQRALKACAERGLVLATCSKNIAADVEAAYHLLLTTYYLPLTTYHLLLTTYCPGGGLPHAT
jgi:hypothetical protein